MYIALKSITYWVTCAVSRTLFIDSDVHLITYLRNYFWNIHWMVHVTVSLILTHIPFPLIHPRGTLIFETSLGILKYV